MSISVITPIRHILHAYFIARCTVNTGIYYREGEKIDKPGTYFDTS